MADKISILTNVVASQIAAGEVVVKPSAVVKEMMENSIDAESSCIIVNFREGGGDLIQIVDNGCGMSPNDARMAFDRHATSKLVKAEDIYSLHTFGFRGEALASIAAVSQVELRTRQADDTVGTSTIVCGGVYQNQETIMCEVGSQFFVRNLFYNTPGRRRFMDRITTSTNQIKADFKRIALCNPNIHFELYSNDQPLYNLPPTSLVSRIVGVVGRNIKQNLLEISANTSIIKLHGYIGTPSSAKKSNQEQYMFVNSRYFRSAYFTKAILKGFDKLIPAGSTPSYFIYFEVDPANVDVNQHPQKIEVRFVDNDDIWQIIVAAVRETLAKTGAVPMMDFDDESPIELPVMGTSPREVVLPKSYSGGEYNPFDEGYIDLKAPDPNIDFTGFDIPYPIAEQQPSNNLKQSRSGSELKDGAYASMIDSFGDGVSSFSDFSSSSNSYNFEGFEDFESITNIETIESDSGQFDFVESVAAPSTLVAKPREVSIRAVTLLGGGYAFMVVDTQPLILDVARAKERVLYDHYLALGRGAQAVSQQLLFPERLILSNEEYELLGQNISEFVAVGFDIDMSGSGEILVKGIPPEIKRDEIDKLIYELLQSAATPETLEQARMEDIARIMAKNGAAIAHRGLSCEQVETLANQLFATGNTERTPSGKPLMWKIYHDEIIDHLK